MRVSFDLDDTLICHGEIVACEPRLSRFVRLFLRDEPLRKGTRDLFVQLRTKGHEIWIYTTSYRSNTWIRLWLWLHDIRVQGIVQGDVHEKRFGKNSVPTKRPHAFGIHLHVDDSPGVAIEGDRYGFNVCIVDPCSETWVTQVLDAVERQLSRK